MREVRRTVIVPYTPAQMYVLVNDVRRYPEFIPWCPATRVFEESETAIRAAVDISRSGITLSITTANVMIPGERIDLRLVDGPLRTLEGSWQFLPITERALPAIPGVAPAQAAADAIPGSSPRAVAAGEAPPAAPTGPSTAPRVRGCRVELDVRFDFRNAALTMLFGPVLEHSYDSLVDAFVVRARDVYR